MSLTLKHISPSLLSSGEHCYPHRCYAHFSNVFPLHLQLRRRNSVRKTHLFQIQALPTMTMDTNDHKNRSEEEDEDEGSFINLTTRTKMDSLLDEEGDAEEESTLLSLSEKPDRNMALLDDYEMEELDFVNDDPRHRSGKLSLKLSISNILWFLVLGCEKWHYFLFCLLSDGCGKCRIYSCSW